MKDRTFQQTKVTHIHSLVHDTHIYICYHYRRYYRVYRLDARNAPRASSVCRINVHVYHIHGIRSCTRQIAVKYVLSFPIDFHTARRRCALEDNAVVFFYKPDAVVDRTGVCRLTVRSLRTGGEKQTKIGVVCTNTTQTRRRATSETPVSKNKNFFHAYSDLFV